MPLATHSGPIDSVAFSPSSHVLATVSRGMVQLWDAGTHQALREPITNGAQRVASLAFSHDGRVLALGGDTSFRLWNTRTGIPLGRRLPAVGPSVALSADGRIAAFISGRRIRLSHGRGREPVSVPLVGSNDGVMGFAFSSDGRTIAVGALDGTIRLWDAHTRRSLGAPLASDAGPVNSLAFSPDARILASGGFDGTIRLWEHPGTRKPLGAPLPGAHSIVRMAFSPDGRSLTSIAADRLIRTWANILWLDAAELRGEVCRLAGNGLSSAEWERYAAGTSCHRSCAWQRDRHRPPQVFGQPCGRPPLPGTRPQADHRAMHTSPSSTAHATFERQPAPQIQHQRPQLHCVASPPADASDRAERAGEQTVDLETLELDAPAVAAALSQRLYAAGVPVAPERAVTLVQALTLVSPLSARNLYWTARAVFVSAPGQLPAFDRVFASIFASCPDAAGAEA